MAKAIYLSQFSTLTGIARATIYRHIASGDVVRQPSGMIDLSSPANKRFLLALGINPRSLQIQDPRPAGRRPKGSPAPVEPSRDVSHDAIKLLKKRHEIIALHTKTAAFRQDYISRQFVRDFLGMELSTTRQAYAELVQVMASDLPTILGCPEATDEQITSVAKVLTLELNHALRHRAHVIGNFLKQVGAEPLEEIN